MIFVKELLFAWSWYLIGIILQTLDCLLKQLFLIYLFMAFQQELMALSQKAGNYFGWCHARSCQVRASMEPCWLLHWTATQISMIKRNWLSSVRPQEAERWGSRLSGQIRLLFPFIPLFNHQPALPGQTGKLAILMSASRSSKGMPVNPNAMIKLSYPSRESAAYTK